MKIVILCLLLCSASLCAFTNKSIFNLEDFRLELRARRPGQQLLLLCEQEICPFSKEGTKIVKDVFKSRDDIDVMLLRIERYPSGYTAPIGTTALNICKWNTFRSCS